MVLPFRYHKYMSYFGKLSWVFFLFIIYFLPISHCPVKSLQVSNGWQMNGSFEGKILEISFLFCCLYFFLIFLQLWTYFTRFWQAKLIDLSTKTNCAFLHNFFPILRILFYPFGQIVLRDWVIEKIYMVWIIFLSLLYVNIRNIVKLYCFPLEYKWQGHIIGTYHSAVSWWS